MGRCEVETLEKSCSEEHEALKRRWAARFSKRRARFFSVRLEQTREEVSEMVVPGLGGLFRVDLRWF